MPHSSRFSECRGIPANRDVSNSNLPLQWRDSNLRSSSRGAQGDCACRSDHDPFGPKPATRLNKSGCQPSASGGITDSSAVDAVDGFSNLLVVAPSFHVPYKGAGPALADVVAGHVDFTVATMPGAIQQVRSSSLRALGISSLTRSPELPRRANHGGWLICRGPLEQTLRSMARWRR
jgi:Tripartite tricarboxylate transporter family receptor